MLSGHSTEVIDRFDETFVSACQKGVTIDFTGEVVAEAPSVGAAVLERWFAILFIVIDVVVVVVVLIIRNDPSDIGDLFE